MANCPHVEGCELFPLFNQRSFLRIWQMSYCERDFEKCQRFQRAGRGEAVPLTLLPNGNELTLPKKGGAE